MIAMGVSDHEGGERVETQAPQLPIDSCLGRSRIDEQRTLRRLEQDPVALADVEQRDAQSCRWRPGRSRMQGPPAERSERHERESGDHHGAPAIRRQQPQAGYAGDHDRERDERRERRGLRVRHRGHQSSRKCDPGGCDTRDPGEGDGCRRDHVDEHRRAEAGSQEHRHRRFGEGVGRHRPERDHAELQPEDRRRHDPARRRDPDHLEDAPRHRISLMRPTESRQREEDRSDRGEGELKAGLEQGSRRPGEQHDRPRGHRVPALARPGQQPRGRCQATGHRSTDDRRLPTDGESVGEDRDDRERVTCCPPQSGHVCEPEDTETDQHDVLARHREEVVEAGGLECVPQTGIDALVGSEHDPDDERSPLARGPTPRASAIAVRSRSPTPPIPPRRPTTCQEPLAWSTT